MSSLLINEQAMRNDHAQDGAAVVVTAYISVVIRVVNIAILKVLQYYWQYFFGYCLHIANTF